MNYTINLFVFNYCTTMRKHTSLSERSSLGIYFLIEQQVRSIIFIWFEKLGEIDIFTDRKAPRIIHDIPILKVYWIPQQSIIMAPFSWSSTMNHNRIQQILFICNFFVSFKDISKIKILMNLNVVKDLVFLILILHKLESIEGNDKILG